MKLQQDAGIDLELPAIGQTIGQVAQLVEHSTEKVTERENKAQIGPRTT